MPLLSPNLSLQADGLTRHFGQVTAVDRLDFSVTGPGIVGLLGPNGAGKTTTIRMCTTALTLSSGRLRMAGFDTVTDAPRVRASVGYLPESVSLPAEARVREALEFTGRLRGLRGQDLSNEIMACLERVGLGDRRDRIIKTLSNGQCRRVGLASALIGNPPILVLDEPTVGLDPGQLISVRSLITELGRDHLVILSSHILSEVEAMCESVLVMNDGRRVAYGPPRTLAADLGVVPTVSVVATGIEPGDLSALVREALTVRASISEATQVPGVGRGSEVVAGDQDGHSRVEVLADPSGTPAVARLLADRGAELHELRIDYPTLEELFLRIVEPDPEGDDL